MTYMVYIGLALVVVFLGLGVGRLIDPPRKPDYDRIHRLEYDLGFREDPPLLASPRGPRGRGPCTCKKCESLQRLSKIQRRDAVAAGMRPLHSDHLHNVLASLYRPEDGMKTEREWR